MLRSLRVLFQVLILPLIQKSLEMKVPLVYQKKSQASIPVKVANGQNFSTLCSVILAFDLGGQTPSQKFLLLQTMNRPNLGLPFFEKK